MQEYKAFPSVNANYARDLAEVKQIARLSREYDALQYNDSKFSPHSGAKT